MRQAQFRTTTALVALIVITACGDARLDKLTLGISTDSAAKAIGEAPHRRNDYQVAGKLWSVQLYARDSATEADSIPWRKMSPVVFIDGKAVGWGWDWWSGASAKQGIAMPK